MYKYLTKKSICHSIYHKSTTILARKCKPKNPKTGSQTKTNKENAPPPKSFVRALEQFSLLCNFRLKRKHTQIYMLDIWRLDCRSGRCTNFYQLIKRSETSEQNRMAIKIAQRVRFRFS